MQWRSRWRGHAGLRPVLVQAVSLAVLVAPLVRLQRAWLAPTSDERPQARLWQRCVAECDRGPAMCGGSHDVVQAPRFARAARGHQRLAAARISYFVGESDDSAGGETASPDERPAPKRGSDASYAVAPRSSDTGRAPARFSGTVQRWLNLKGIGWIEPDAGGEKIFVHVESIDWHEIRGGFRSLQEGERVEYEVVPNPRDPSRKIAWNVTGPGGDEVMGGYDRGQRVGWRAMPRRDTNTEVYVGNLAFKTLWWQLRDHFDTVGMVKSARISTDGWDDKNDQPFSNGWGTVRFRTVGEARRAIDELNGSQLHGREIYVKWYDPKSYNDDEEDDDEPLLHWT
mmetsp:Transcript_85563/g.238854  ORF Transcript_85563/g.238854 Transcript_85563/m.238854 type:complete len:341 (-) Transcript_85563:135-1157(-)